MNSAAPSRRSQDVAISSVLYVPQSLRELIPFRSLIPPMLLAFFWYLNSFIPVRKKRFNPKTDIANLKGRVILVTGANTGIGKETVLQFAKHEPTRIYLAARTEAKAEVAIADIKRAIPGAQVCFLHLDLASFASIRKAVEIFTADSTRLDLLICNAGIMATPLAKTSDGYEAQFGTNYMGHALLTKLLLPTLLKTAEDPAADVRIINVSSIGHHMAPPGGIIFETEQLMKQSPFRLYGQSKLANILFTKALATRYPRVTAVAVHPGTIMTDLYSAQNKSNVLVKSLMSYVAPLFFADVHYGALNQLWAATVPRPQVISGGYYMPVGNKTGGSSYARDAKLVTKLWDWTEEEFSRLAI